MRYAAIICMWSGARGVAIFFKRCNLVRFGVYLDQILSLKFLNNHHFLYKRNKYFRYTLFLMKKLFETF